MQIYKLHSIHNCKALYEGRFYSFTACLEQAVKDNVNLTGIDLRHKNLSNANLDDAFMPRADFTNTNLSGANLSDAKLQEANFRGAALYNTYFCSANLYGGNFENAFFGATDIWDADISHARFSALSCFSLDFGKAQKMHGCRFTDINGNVRKMSRPPHYHTRINTRSDHTPGRWRANWTQKHNAFTYQRFGPKALQPRTQSPPSYRKTPPCGLKHPIPHIFRIIRNR